MGLLFFWLLFVWVVLLFYDLFSFFVLFCLFGFGEAGGG